MTGAVLLAAAALAYQTLTHRLRLPRWTYVPLNVVAGLVVVVVVRAAGVGWEALGLGPGQLDEGLRWGRVVVVGLAVGVAAAAALAGSVSWVGRLFSDRRAAGLEGRALAYETLVRIPVGTSLFEEVVFRGGVHALAVGGGSVVAAVGLTNIAFGLWHVNPTLETLRINRVAWEAGGVAGTVGMAVLATAVAGVGLSLLRIWSGSLLAPVLAHWAANALGLLAAAVIQRTGGP